MRVMSGAQDGVLFVHGNPGSGRHWDRFAGPAQRAIGGGPVLTPTLPGFAGAPTAPGFSFSIEAYSRWLGEAIDAAGMERVHLVLHDFGGAFGLDWAVAQPERLASLVLIDTGVMADYRWHALARLWRTPLVGELFNAVTTRKGFGRTINHGQSKPLPEAFVDQLYRELDRETRRTVLQLYRNTPESRLGALAASIDTASAPVLVLWGERDLYLPVGYAHRQLETFPDAEVVVLPDCGHWPQAEQPALVEQHITGFLQKAVAHA